MKMLGKVKLLGSVSAYFTRIGQGDCESYHLIIANGKDCLLTRQITGVREAAHSVLEGMTKQDEAVVREPIDISAALMEVDETFTFHPPPDQSQTEKCRLVQNLCQQVAQVLVQIVPEGKEQTMAVNNLLAATLFACHGITHRQVGVFVAPPEGATSQSGENI
jgi:hypothetical protein